MKYRDNGPYRLVHDGNKVIMFAELPGTRTHTNHVYFSGTKQECLDEISRLGLVLPEEAEE